MTCRRPSRTAVHKLTLQNSESEIIPGPHRGAAVTALRRRWETVTPRSSATGKMDWAVSDMILPP
jgi:hypothetical protein